jgi:predicted 2-oxoglutarate/Fe(II)-dependent dioxygenase YbiX
VEDFLSPDECRDLVRLADATAGRQFTMLDRDGNRRPDEHRVAEWLDFRDSDQQLLDEVVARAFDDHIIPCTGQSIDWYEQPQLLRYTAGGFYFHHSDAYLFDLEIKAWRKAVDRDISVLIYLNDDYDGGELEFKRLFYTIQPRSGMLLWFPSDVRYEHMAKPVISGYRYALASWAAASGVERVQTKRADRSILWVTREKKL